MQLRILTRASLDLHPCTSGFVRLRPNLDHKIDGVEVSLPLAAALYFNERAILELGGGATHSGHIDPHVLGKAFLAGKTKAVVPSVAKEERIDGLRVGGEGGVAENEIGKLRKPVPRDWVGGVELHVLFKLLEPVVVA